MQCDQHFIYRRKNSLAIILGGALLGLEGIWLAFSVTSIVKGIIFVCTFCWITRGKGG